MSTDRLTNDDIEFTGDYGLLWDFDATRFKAVGPMALLRLTNPAKTHHDVERDDGTTIKIWIPKRSRPLVDETKIWEVVSHGEGFRPPKKIDRHRLHKVVDIGSWVPCPLTVGDRVILARRAGRTGGRSAYLANGFMLVNWYYEVEAVLE